MKDFESFRTGYMSWRSRMHEIAEQLSVLRNFNVVDAVRTHERLDTLLAKAADQPLSALDESSQPFTRYGRAVIVITLAPPH